MRKVNVLVTGVGAVIGYGIIKSLRASRFETHIVGMDIYPDAVGQHWSDVFVQALPAASENYIPFLEDLIDQHGFDLVMFGTEQEIQKVSACRSDFGAHLNKLVVNTPLLVDLAWDKWKTYHFLKDHGISTIDTLIECTYRLAADRWGLPFLLKPRRSYASKGIVRITSEEDFDFWKRKNGDNFMVQEIIGDDDHEYTVGIFGLGDGSYTGGIAFRRKLSQAGATDKAWVTQDDRLTEEVTRLTRVFKPIGPTNYQFRLHNNKYLLLEVNPRISASTSLRTAFGYNEAEMCIEYFLENTIPPDRSIRQGHAIRFISDWVIYS